MPAVLRVIGPPGSGKTLLIVSLTEALRSRGHRVATAVRRDTLVSALTSTRSPELPNARTGATNGTGAANGSATTAAEIGATVVVLSNGARVTLPGTKLETNLGTNQEQPSLRALAALIPTLDPSVELILAEAFEDPGYSAIVLAPRGAPPAQPRGGDVIAVVSSEAIAAAFARSGPGETGGLADLVERTLLGESAQARRNRTRRLRFTRWLTRGIERLRRRDGAA